MPFGNSILPVAQKMKFSIKDSFSKCDPEQIINRNFIFYAVYSSVLIHFSLILTAWEKMTTIFFSSKN